MLAMFVQERCRCDVEDLCWFQFLAYLKHIPIYNRVKHGAADSREADVKALQTFKGEA